MIERNRPRKRKPRISQRRNTGLKVYNNQHNNPPKSRNGVSKALEKYTSLAQDAQSNGDRIVAENFFQYAEHYQRLLNEEFGFDPKTQSNNNLENKKIDVNVDNGDSSKPSRTQRAINAKSDRLDNHNENSENKKNQKNDNFTSDGLEALKPFESSINQKNSQ